MRLIARKTSGFCNLVNKEFRERFDEPSFAKLSNRGIIVVQGPETRKFLQGLTTNNISLLYDNSNTERVAIYSLFLNPKGKVVTDAFIIRPQVYQNGVKISQQDELWIDVSKSTCTNLFEHLRKYTWKKKVELSNLSYEDDAPDITAGFNKVIPKNFANLHEIKDKCGLLFKIQSEQSTKAQPIDDGGYANMAFFDPRGVHLGVRLVCAPNGFIYKGAIRKTDEEQYNKICLLNGISMSETMVNKLPFMFNSDLFNGFSFKKGCYLGQQIIARAYFTGIVRRRIFPFLLKDDTKIEAGAVLYDKDNNELGKVVESQAGYGTVLVNYLPLLQSKWPLKIEKPAQGSIKMPFQNLLRDYIHDIKSKQAKLEQIDL